MVVGSVSLAKGMLRVRTSELSALQGHPHPSHVAPSSRRKAANDPAYRADQRIDGGTKRKGDGYRGDQPGGESGEPIEVGRGSALRRMRYRHRIFHRSPTPMEIISPTAPTDPRDQSSRLSPTRVSHRPSWCARPEKGEGSLRQRVSFLTLQW